MTDTEERQTHADWLIVFLLCQFENQFPGPNAWLCRQAWIAYSFGRPFDVDAVIAEHMAYLNAPQNAELRERLVGCCEHLKRIAAKKPLWDIPDDAFDITDWIIQPTEGQTTCHEPRSGKSSPSQNTTTAAEPSPCATSEPES